MRVQIIDIDIYKCRLVVFRGGTLKEVHKWLDDEYIEKDDEEIVRSLLEQFDEVIGHSGGAFIWYERENFVWLPTSSGMPELAHELYHAANHILTQLGVKHDEQDEPFAYLLEHLTRQVLKKPAYKQKTPTAADK